MGFSFETLGNATIQVSKDGNPRLVTDPWLVGTCYFGSWAHDHPISERQLANACASPWVFFSHGHPDHLHTDSLPLLDREKQEILVPGHYRPEMEEYLRSEGFRVVVLPFKTWHRLEDGLEVLALPNDNQDAALLIRAGGDLLIDQNDSPISGEEPFLRREIRRAERSWLFMLCSNDADMLNIVDAEGNSLAGDPDMKKPGTVLSVGDFATSIGVQHFCCSSSQHIYVRRDTAWANPYRITWADMKKHWVSSAELLPPFVEVDLDTGERIEHHPSQTSNFDAVTDRDGDDDWSAPFSDAEWSELESYFARFELLRERLDFVAFTIAGERRDFPTHPDGKPRHGGRGVHFRVPRHSLLEAIRAGYFDELLIGNFMKTELIGGARLYPDFTPIVAKLGGNAKVLTAADRRAFRRHYFRLSPAAWIRHALGGAGRERTTEWGRRLSRRLGIFETAKRWRRRWSGLPPLPASWPPEE